mgnify:FL=1
MHADLERVVRALAAVYETHAAGCCWHILADDGNVRRKDVAFCVKDARTHGHPACLAVIEPMLALSWTQRRHLLRHYDRYGAS